jgi:hypothetical protein
MLPLALTDVDASLIQRACNERWAEGPRLEFKRQLPGKDNSARNEFLKDVTAMANSEGGDLIYGVDECEGTASTLEPMTSESADEATQRLGQMLDSSVEPRIAGVRMRHVSVGAGYCLVIRVPASFDGPHRYTVNGVNRFVLRNHTHTAEMSYGQLRDAFGKRASLLERAEEFITSRARTARTNIRPYMASSSGFCVIHVVPLAGLAGRVSLDIATLHHDYSGFQFTDECAWTRTTNRDGLAIHQPQPADADYFVQVFRDGSIEAIFTAVGTSTYKATIVGAWLAEHLQAILRKYQERAKVLGISGPGVVGLALNGIAQTILATTDRAMTRSPYADDFLATEPLQVNDVTDLGNLPTLIRPMLDLVYQSYGVPSCTLYDEAGNLKPR